MRLLLFISVLLLTGFTERTCVERQVRHKKKWVESKPACFDVIRPNFCKEILKSLTDQIKDSETWIEETKEYKDAVEFLK